MRVFCMGSRGVALGRAPGNIHVILVVGMNLSYLYDTESLDTWNAAFSSPACRPVTELYVLPYK